MVFSTHRMVNQRRAVGVIPPAGEISPQVTKGGADRRPLHPNIWNRTKQKNAPVPTHKDDKMPRYHLVSPFPHENGLGKCHHTSARSRAHPSRPNFCSAEQLRGHVHRVPPRPLSPCRTLLWRYLSVTLPFIAFHSLATHRTAKSTICQE